MAAAPCHARVLYTILSKAVESTPPNWEEEVNQMEGSVSRQRCVVNES